jgi:hypothetical protein
MQIGGHSLAAAIFNQLEIESSRVSADVRRESDERAVEGYSSYRE